MPETIDPQTVSLLETVSVATLTTCLFRRGFRNRLIADVRPVNPTAARMVGPAFTLRFIPAREDIDTMEAYADPEHVHRRAIEECPADAVLVIDARGDTAAASAGDIMLGRLQQRGVAGVVTDGGFRDSDDIVALGFPAYHKTPAPPSSPIRHHPADLNLPIGCGGVAVYPGDVIVGDCEGVVVIPSGLAEEVAAEAGEMTAYETFAAEKVAEGRSILALYPATDESRQAFEAWRESKSK